MITSLTYEQTSPTQYRFAYTSNISGATFYIWIDGTLVTTTLETSYVVTVGVGGQVQFDVFDDADSVPDEHFPPQLTLRWEGRDGVSMYRVDRSVDAAWVPQEFIPFRTSNLYHYTTAPLDDVTEHTFRAVPVDVEGRDGIALEFVAEMVRYPDAPAQTFQFVSGELQIT